MNFLLVPMLLFNLSVFDSDGFGGEKDMPEIRYEIQAGVGIADQLYLYGGISDAIPTAGVEPFDFAPNYKLGAEWKLDFISFGYEHGFIAHRETGQIYAHTDELFFKIEVNRGNHGDK